MPEAPAACGAGVNGGDAAITARNQCVFNPNGNLIAQACVIAQTCDKPDWFLRIA